MPAATAVRAFSASILRGLAAATATAVAVAALAVLLTWGAGLTAPKQARADWSCFLNAGGCVNGRLPTLEAACNAIARFRAGNDYQLTAIKITGPGSAQCYWSGAWTVYSPEPTRAFCRAGELYNAGRASGCQKGEPAKGWGACEGSGCPTSASTGPGSPGGPVGGTGRSAAGNPVTLDNGNKYVSVTDYRSSGPDVLEFTRSFNSKTWVPGDLGHGWRSNFGISVPLATPNRADPRRPDGQIPFFYSSTGDNPWTPDADIVERLVETAGGWEYIRADDTVETYDAAGKLVTIEKKNGYTQTMVRDPVSGLLTSVSDSHGRTLSFTYITGDRGLPLIHTMTDPDGRVYIYEYQGINDYAAAAAVLNRVVYPDDDDAPFGVRDAPLGVNDVLYSHLDGPDGATSATDESAGAHPLTFAGTAQIDTAQSHLGGASALFDGTLTSYVSAPDSADWEFGAGQFTIEAWARFASTPVYATLARHWGSADGQHSWSFDWYNGQARFVYTTDGTGASMVVLAANWTPTLGAWHHVAVDRDSDNRLRVYVDGRVLLETTVTAAFYNSPAVVDIGVLHTGWIDEVRITKGEARYAEGWASRLNNPAITYHYEDSRYGYGLTGITDETGQRTATWGYDAEGQVISSEHAGGTDRVDIGYGAGTRTVSNPLGKQFTYSQTTLVGLPRITQLQRLASASTPAGTMNFTYDANAFMASSTDWNGNVTTYTHDARGLQTSRTEGFGTPEARTTTR
jgi:YD repeat-containing protein